MIIRALAGAVTGLVAGGTLAVAFIAVTPAPGPGPQVAGAPTAQPARSQGAAPQLDQPQVSVTPTPAVPGEAAPRRTLGDQPSEPTPDVSVAPAPVRAAPGPDTLTAPATPSQPQSPLTDAPVLPAPLATAPRLPTGERDVVLGSAPVAPAEVAVEPSTPSSAESPATLPVTPPAAPPVSAPGALGAADAPSLQTPSSTEPQPQPQPTPPADLPPVQIATPGSGVPAGDMAPAAPGAPGTGTSPLAQGMLPLAPLVTTGAERVAEGSGPVRINRPRDEAKDPAQSALVRYGEPVVIQDDVPLLSIVLMHDNIESIPGKTLQDLPFPVSIALLPQEDSAPDTMRRYRDLGHEILAIADLPRGAAPEDMAVSLEATFDLLPEAIGLLDAGSVALGSDRSVIATAVGRLKADGRGLVTLSSGLNMAEREALRQQVPVAVVYRDMDGEGQAKRTIRRFLDQASFRARQQGHVVLLARLKTITIEALNDWGRRPVERAVQIVPVSALLRAQHDAQHGAPATNQ